MQLLKKFPDKCIDELSVELLAWFPEQLLEEFPGELLEEFTDETPGISDKLLEHYF